MLNVTSWCSKMGLEKFSEQTCCCPMVQNPSVPAPCTLNNDWEHVWVSYIWGFRNFLNGFQLSLYGMFLKAVLYCFIASTSGIADALLLRNDHGKHGQSGKSYWTHTEFRASLWVNFCFETRVMMWDTATLTDGDTRWPSTWSSTCRLTRLP